MEITTLTTQTQGLSADEKMANHARTLMKLADEVEERGRSTLKAAHLRDYVSKATAKAARYLYQIIDYGPPEEAWPWSRGHKPGRNLFVSKGDFSMFSFGQLPETQGWIVSGTSKRFKLAIASATTCVNPDRIRLADPETMPDQFIKDYRISVAFGIAKMELVGLYPSAFRIDPHHLNVNLSEGDEADQTEYWLRQADILVDGCRLLSRLALRERKPGLKRSRAVDKSASGTSVSKSAAVRPDPVALAITMKAKDPTLPVRKVASAVGMPYSTLQKHPLWRTVVDRLKQVGAGNVRPGSKSVDGIIEAIDG